MSVYPNQTNVSLGSSFFAAAGSGGGGGTPSNWSSYPALTAITYSGAGGIANFTELNSLYSISTPYVLAETIESSSQITSPLMATVSFQTSTINGSAYPPAGSAPIVGTLPIPADSTTVTTETIAGITGSSIIIGTLTSSAACQIVALQPGSNQFTIDVTPGAPSATRFNYVIYPAAT